MWIGLIEFPVAHWNSSLAAKADSNLVDFPWYNALRISWLFNGVPPLFTLSKISNRTLSGVGYFMICITNWKSSISAANLRLVLSFSKSMNLHPFKSGNIFKPFSENLFSIKWKKVVSLCLPSTITRFPSIVSAR